MVWYYDRSTPANIWRQKKLGARPSKFIVCESIHPCCGSPLDTYISTMYMIQKYLSVPRCGFPYNTYMYICTLYVFNKSIHPLCGFPLDTCTKVFIHTTAWLSLQYMWNLHNTKVFLRMLISGSPDSTYWRCIFTTISLTSHRFLNDSRSKFYLYQGDVFQSYL